MRSLSELKQEMNAASKALNAVVSEKEADRREQIGSATEGGCYASVFDFTEGGIDAMDAIISYQAQTEPDPFIGGC